MGTSWFGFKGMGGCGLWEEMLFATPFFPGEVFEVRGEFVLRDTELDRC